MPLQSGNKRQLDAFYYLNRFNLVLPPPKSRIINPNNLYLTLCTNILCICSLISDTSHKQYILQDFSTFPCLWLGLSHPDISKQIRDCLPVLKWLNSGGIVCHWSINYLPLPAFSLWDNSLLNEFVSILFIGVNSGVRFGQFTELFTIYNLYLSLKKKADVLLLGVLQRVLLQFLNGRQIAPG